MKPQMNLSMNILRLGQLFDIDILGFNFQRLESKEETYHETVDEKKESQRQAGQSRATLEIDYLLFL